MKKLIAILPLMFFAACTTLCPLGKSTAASVSVAMGGMLQCKRIDLIQSDLEAKLKSTGVCKEADGKMRGPVGDIACPIVVPIAIGMASKLVPTKYGCELTELKDNAASILTKACQGVVPL